MVDGVHLAEHLVLVALGIDEQEGAAETAAVCTSLLTDLVARRTRTDPSTLFVFDGGKAMAKAIRIVVGAKALVRRCQVHEQRNVQELSSASGSRLDLLEHLPPPIRRR
jgi:hypothetical protein